MFWMGNDKASVLSLQDIAKFLKVGDQFIFDRT